MAYAHLTPSENLSARPNPHSTLQGASTPLAAHLIKTSNFYGVGTNTMIEENQGRAVPQHLDALGVVVASVLFWMIIGVLISRWL